jgi:transposase-like protein
MFDTYETEPTKTIREQALDLLRHGVPPEQVSRYLQVSMGALRFWARLDGLDPELDVPRWKRRSDPVALAALRLRQRGMSKQKVARTLGCDVGRVDDLGRKAEGLLKGDQPRLQRARHPRRDKGERMIREGLRNCEIARYCAVHESTVAQWRSALGIHPVEQQKEAAIEMIRGGAWPFQVARELNISLVTVYLWMRQHGIRPESISRRRRTMEELCLSGWTDDDVAWFCDEPADKVARLRRHLPPVD